MVESRWQDSICSLPLGSSLHMLWIFAVCSRMPGVRVGGEAIKGQPATQPDPTRWRSFYPTCLNHSLLTGPLRERQSTWAQSLHACVWETRKQVRLLGSTLSQTPSQPSLCFCSVVRSSFSKDYLCAQVLPTWSPRSTGDKRTQEELLTQGHQGDTQGTWAGKAFWMK